MLPIPNEARPEIGRAALAEAEPLPPRLPTAPFPPPDQRRPHRRRYLPAGLSRSDLIHIAIVTALAIAAEAFIIGKLLVAG